jgi:ABC-type sugar transport system ATPase subunit
MSDTTALLAVDGVTKSFGSVRALRGVSMAFHAHDVHAIVGENGAGKSTLMNILSGVYRPDSGSIAWGGDRVTLDDPGVAVRLGIGIAYQELSLFQNLTVAENIFGQAPGAGPIMRRAGLRAETAELIKESGFERFGIRPDHVVGSLSVGLQQQVEILKALSNHPRLLILDEPTSSLSAVQTEELFATIKRLSAGGLSVVYISHHLSEVFQVADRVTVLKDGQLVATHPIAEVTEDLLVSEMVGRELTRSFAAGARPVSDGYVLEAAGLQKDPYVAEFSLHVRRGEIVGLAGLVGAGRTEALRLVAGLDKPTAGTVTLEGKLLPRGDAAKAMEAGVVYVTEDRRTDGLFLDKTIWENLRARRIAGPRLAERESLRQSQVQARHDIGRFGIVTPSEVQLASKLSGGNQQKVLLASRINCEPTVLLVDEPTRGVDVGAREQIYVLLRNLADEGLAVVIASSDLLELRGLCDRALVLRAGRVVGELDRDHLNEETIIALATGTTEGIDS